jgi:hypothetical protein
MKTTKTLSQDTVYPNQDSNRDRIATYDTYL